MRLSAKINQLIHRLMVKRVVRAYDKKSRRVEKKHPELFKPVDAKLSERHKSLWGQLGVRSGDRWLRLHVNLTGIQDYTFCPEDIFFARVERILNDCDSSGKALEDKNNFWRYVPNGCEPEVVCRYVRGAFCDAQGCWLAVETVRERLAAEDGELVGKPCDSSGGNGVQILRGDQLTPEWIARQGLTYVVQRKIEQDAFSASFNVSSINTVRMMTLRCPWDGEIVVCRSMMRMGVSDAVVDNMMKGGLCVCVGDKGLLGKYAYDYDGKRYERHPVSDRAFEGLIHPGYEKMVSLAKQVHSTVPDFNLLSFDFVPRRDGSVCIVEINATSQGITQLQYDFGGLFGAYTEKVVAWCKDHLDLDTFKHLRTFY